MALARVSFFSIISRTRCNGTAGSVGWRVGEWEAPVIAGFDFFYKFLLQKSLLKTIWKKKQKGHRVGVVVRRPLAGGCSSPGSNAHRFENVRLHQGTVLAVPQFPHPPCSVASWWSRLRVSPRTASCPTCPSPRCLPPSWRQKSREHFWREQRGEISPLGQSVFPLSSAPVTLARQQTSAETPSRGTTGHESTSARLSHCLVFRVVGGGGFLSPLERCWLPEMRGRCFCSSFSSSSPMQRPDNLA